MAAQPAVWGAAWRNKLQAVLMIAIAVIALVAALVLLYIDRHDAAELSAYNSAAVCATPADAIGSEACRYMGQANVVSTRRDTRLFVVVAFDSMPGRTFNTSWPTKTEPDMALLSPGSAIDAEVWSGKITRLGGTRTVDSPENIAMGLWELSAFFAILGLPLLLIGVQSARSAGRDRAIVAPVAPSSTSTQLSARWRYMILAAIFLLLGTPLSVFLVINARGGFELAYRAITGIVLFVIAVRLAWLGWRAK